jgi:quercetin dioxygenase-like cupin family protein
MNTVYSQITRLGQHAAVSFQGLTTRYLLVDDEHALLEHELAPRALGAPMHAHACEDELSHVTAGRLGVQIGDDVLEATAGDTVVKPRGVPHAFWNPGDEPVRFVELITPGALFAGYFADVAPILATDGPPDLAALGAAAARYGLAMEPESVPRLVAAHGLR